MKKTKLLKALLLALMFIPTSLFSDQYIVKKGDTLSGISRNFYKGNIYGKNGSLNKLLTLNPTINNPNLIIINQKINTDGLTPDQNLQAVDFSLPPEVNTEVQEEILVKTDHLPEETVEGLEIAAENISGNKHINISDIETGANFIDSESLPSTEIGSTDLGAESVRLSAQLATLDGKKRFFKPFTLIPAVGVSSITYRETGRPNLHQTALTLSAAVRVDIIDRFFIKSSGSISGLASSTSGNSETGKYLDSHLNAGYEIPIGKSSFSAELAAGINYARAFVKRNVFGYTNVFGPEFSPTLRYRMNHKNTFDASTRITLIPKSNKTLSFANRHFGGGLSWNYELNNGNRLLAFADASVLQINLARFLDISSNTFTLGVGYVFR